MIQLIGLTDALATIPEHCDAIGMQPSLMVCAINPNGGRFRGRVSGRTAAHFVPESPRLPEHLPAGSRKAPARDQDDAVTGATVGHLATAFDARRFGKSATSSRRHR